MAWTGPRTWVAGEVVTNAVLNTHIRDNLRYLKGNDGTTVFEDTVVLTGTAHMLVANVVTSANRPVGAVGGLVYNTSSGNFQVYEGTAWFDRRDIRQMTATGQGTGDIFYADTPTSVARLAAGGSGSVLQANGAAAVSWGPNAGAIALLRAGSGAYTATASGTLDAFNIAGLGNNDRVMVMGQAIAGVTTAFTGLYIAYGTAGDRVPITSQTPTINFVTVGEGWLSRGTNSTALIALVVAPGSMSGSAITGSMERHYNTTGTINAAWTGTWNLALETTGMAVQGATMTWSWNVYRLKDA